MDSGRLGTNYDVIGRGGTLALEVLVQVGLGGEPRDPALHGGVGLYLGGVEEELLTPHQPRLRALLDDPLEESTEDGKTVALTDAGEAGVIGQRLVEVVSEVPPQREAVRDYPISWRSERMSSKNMTSCSLKKTTGSTLGLPSLA